MAKGLRFVKRQPPFKLQRVRHEPGEDVTHGAKLWDMVMFVCAAAKGLRGVNWQAAVQLHRMRHEPGYPQLMLRVLPVPSDGNCLFASVAISEAETAGLYPSAAELMSRAAELRAAAMAEMRRRRAEIEWSMEGNFDRYVANISRPGTFAGEHELLMLAHYLQRPILVYAFAPELRRITVYTEQLVGTAVPLRVLYLGFGIASVEHYEGLALIELHDRQGETLQEGVSRRNNTPTDRPRKAKKPRGAQAANRRWTPTCPKMLQCCFEGLEALWRRS